MYLGFQIIGKLMPPPSVTERHRNRAFCRGLADDELVQTIDGVDGGEGLYRHQHLIGAQRIILRGAMGTLA